MHTKTNDPNDPKTGGHAGASMQFKTVTQMTQMTQRLAAHKNNHNARRGMGRADGIGPTKTYGS